jgi:hypothetical protein
MGAVDAAHTVTSAVALFGWSMADADDYYTNGDDFYVQRAPDAVRGTVLDNLALMRTVPAARFFPLRFGSVRIIESERSA